MAKIVLKKHIFLIGLPLSGKSSLVLSCKERLNLPTVDIDAEIERMTNLDIPSIWEKYGEFTFRTLERYVLATILCNSPKIVACGGGISNFMDNMSLISTNSVIYIQANPIMLAKRKIVNRPLFFNQNEIVQKLEDLFIRRKESYERAQFWFPTQDGIEQNADSFINFLVKNRLIS